VELSFRFAALQVGFWLGWASIVVVLAGLALDVSARHRWLLVGATMAAAAGNTVAMVIPWREWLATRRGRVLLDLWCGGLIAFVALLVAGAGSNFALLLFLAVPFIAVVQIGWRRGFWLVVSGVTCASVAALIPLSAGATAMRLALVAAAVAVALVLARTIRREAAAHKRAAARSSSERWRERRITGSRTTSKQPPTCSSSGAPTAPTGRRSTTQPHASVRSQPCTACSPRPRIGSTAARSFAPSRRAPLSR
jgi:hypothetical protein